MTKIATMGTASCATIAIQWFKNGDAMNDAYLANPDPKIKELALQEAKNFYSNILYPVRQDQGRTETDLPFTAIMEAIEATGLRNKYIAAVINQSQQSGKDGYWPKQLEKWGFTLIDVTDNDIGGLNYIYTRNRLRPAKAEQVSFNPFVAGAKS